MKGLMITGALLAALFSSSAMAWDCNYWSQSTNPNKECYKAPSTGNTNKQHQSQQQAQLAEAKAISNSASNSTSSSNAQGGAGGSADQQQQQKQSADNAGNQQISNYNSPRIPVNTAIAGIGMTTAGCRYAEGLGVQTSPAGASIGFSFKDKDCSRFSLAQFLYSRGQNEAGDKVMCKIKLIQDALGADCLIIIALQQQTIILEQAPPGSLLNVPGVYPPGEAERRQREHGFPRIQK